MTNRHKKKAKKGQRNRKHTPQVQRPARGPESELVELALQVGLLLLSWALLGALLAPVLVLGLLYLRGRVLAPRARPVVIWSVRMSSKE